MKRDIRIVMMRLVVTYMIALAGSVVLALALGKLWLYRIALALAFLPMFIFLAIEVFVYTLLKPADPRELEREYEEELERISKQIAGIARGEEGQ